ncbi:hypothetical protein CEP53_011224, partial [Fusarium sp. AF-6]
MSGPPPPPPPHGGVPKGSGLPPGKYDIFVIPEHSSGSGFLYLPSMKPNVNSFAAGFASALILVVLGQTLAPAFRTWWDGFQGLGNVAMSMLVIGVGFGAWSLGRLEQEDGVHTVQRMAQRTLEVPLLLLLTAPLLLRLHTMILLLANLKVMAQEHRGKDHRIRILRRVVLGLSLKGRRHHHKRRSEQLLHRGMNLNHHLHPHHM